MKQVREAEAGAGVGVGVGVCLNCFTAQSFIKKKGGTPKMGWYGTQMYVMYHLFTHTFGVSGPCSLSKFGHVSPLCAHFWGFSGPCSLPNVGPQDKVFKRTLAPALEVVSLIRFSAFDQAMLTQKYFFVSIAGRNALVTQCLVQNRVGNPQKCCVNRCYVPQLCYQTGNIYTELYVQTSLSVEFIDLYTLLLQKIRCIHRYLCFIAAKYSLSIEFTNPLPSLPAEFINS